MEWMKRKYQVGITIDDFTDRILKRVGQGNRAKGVRILARRFAEKNQLIELDSPEALDDSEGEILPVPGDPDFKY